VPTSAAEPLLDVSGLASGYGKIRVLHDINFRLYSGEVVALLGPNGAGKTTLLRAISGLLPRTGGIRFGGIDLGSAGSREIAKSGLVHVIEGHRIFTQLTVSDNLLLAAYDCPSGERLSRIDDALLYFPEIAAKRHDRGSSLSGGQQQMLAVAQGLVRRPRLLMLDEPSAGLSPVLVDRVLSVVNQLRKSGTAVLLVEQLVDKSLAVSDRVYAMAKGRFVFEASADEPNVPQRLEEAYLGETQGRKPTSEQVRAQDGAGAV
jgi:branched-chain amino acid transport system ATP-binding protein